MKITDSTGTWDLNENEIPSLDEKNLIAGSVADGDDEFIAICNASTEFPDDLTCAQFELECIKWVAGRK